MYNRFNIKDKRTCTRLVIIIHITMVIGILTTVSIVIRILTMYNAHGDTVTLLINAY